MIKENFDHTDTDFVLLLFVSMVASLVSLALQKIKRLAAWNHVETQHGRTTFLWGFKRLPAIRPVGFGRFQIEWKLVFNVLTFSYSYLRKVDARWQVVSKKNPLLIGERNKMIRELPNCTTTFVNFQFKNRAPNIWETSLQSQHLACTWNQRFQKGPRHDLIAWLIIYKILHCSFCFWT